MKPTTNTDFINFLKSLPQHPQKSEAWLNQRKGKLTSSDAATALGINPYEKPIKLLFKKNNAGEPFVGNVATKFGEKYETEAINLYCKLMNKVNYEFGLIEFSAVNRFRLETSRGNVSRPKDLEEWLNFLAGSPDGVALPTSELDHLCFDKGPVLLEVKCPFRRKIIPGYIPEYYYPQVQLNMAILNIDKADFIEYTPANVEPHYLSEPILNIVRIHRDFDWFDRNVPILYKFWQEVLHWRSVGIIHHPEYNKHAYIKVVERREERKEKKEMKEKLESEKQTQTSMIFVEC